MSDKDLSPDELIACEVCLKEVPATDAESSETADYVAHFCGLECYEQWHKQKAETEQK